MIRFHEYLVTYRLTPRTRIMRKHMPKMDAIYEQESAYETSSIMISQGKAAPSDAVSQAASYTTKFRFNQDGNVDDSASSDEEIDHVLETEVLQ